MNKISKVKKKKTQKHDQHLTDMCDFTPIQEALDLGFEIDGVDYEITARLSYGYIDSDEGRTTYLQASIMFLDAVRGGDVYLYSDDTSEVFSVCVTHAGIYYLTPPIEDEDPFDNKNEDD